MYLSPSRHLIIFWQFTRGPWTRVVRLLCIHSTIFNLHVLVIEDFEDWFKEEEEELLVGTYESHPTRFPLHLDEFVLIHTRIWWVSGLHGNSPLWSKQSDYHGLKVYKDFYMAYCK